MMQAFAHLTREERISLGIAAAAHIALFATLALYDNKRARMPIPERMVVSLADEISLRSTAPDPTTTPRASVAPEIAPAPTPPEPVEVEPVRPDPTPTAAPEPRLQPVVTPRPQPRQTQTQRPAGTRIGSDFLEGTGTSTNRDRAGSTATEVGPQVQASIGSAMARQIKPHWSAPQGVQAELLITVLDWDLNPDGSLNGSPRVRSQSGITDSNRPQASLHAERAIRAVQLAAPFNLPDQYYDVWKSPRRIRFDRNF